MNDINEMPPKCQYCPYWEVCEYPWVCPDREQLATKLQQTCHATDTISRKAAIDAVKKNTFRLTFAEEQNCEGHVAWSAEAVYSDVMEGALLELPSAQPEIVMCADCQKYIDYRCRDEHANLNDWRHEDDYCSFGKRREVEHETD